jgi:hypothetical protein
LDLGNQPSLESATARIVEGPARIAAYNLQALGRIYESENKIFEDVRKDFKELEDAIGTYDKWANVILAAKARNSNQDTLRRLETQLASAQVSIKNLLKEKSWIPTGRQESKLNKIRKKLESYDWPKEKVDRQKRIEFISEEIEVLKKRKYKFETLEEGNGIHELRRDIKWIVIELRVLNGLFVFKSAPNQCAVNAYKDLVNLPIAKSKYSALPGSQREQSTCEIDQCLFLGLVSLVEEIGLEKDAAEADLNIQGNDQNPDQVSASVREKITLRYNQMMDSGLLKELGKQVASCL